MIRIELPASGPLDPLEKRRLRVESWRESPSRRASVPYTAADAPSVLLLKAAGIIVVVVIRNSPIWGERREKCQRYGEELTTESESVGSRYK
jgi:hypothetical protein